MKIVVLSDIHANLAAFQAVLNHIESIAPDAVIIGGDVVNRGPQPREVLDIVIDKINHHGWRIIKGNHEDYVLLAARGVDHLPQWRREVFAHTAWTAERIKDYIPVIEHWPDDLAISAPDGSALRCFHASQRGNRVGLYESMDDDEIHEHTDGISSAICVGHTHVPFIRYVHGTLVVNAGAVGMPFDGIPDASIALVEWTPNGWHAENIRIPYDRELTRQSMIETGYIRDGGLMVRMIVEELEYARPYLGSWHKRYEKLVEAGEIGIQESIDQMIAERRSGIL